MPEHRPVSVYLILGLGMLSFMASPILVRLADDSPAMAVAAWRTLFASVMLVPFAFRIGPEVRRFTRRERVMVLIAGILLSLHFVMWITSVYYTTVASASVLVTTNPLFIAILGFVFLGERLSRTVVVSILVAVAGAACIGLGDEGTVAGAAQQPLLGNSLAVTAAFVFSIYLLIGRVVRQRYSWLGYVVPLYAIVAATTWLLAWAMGTPLWGHSASFYGLCLLMALGPSLLGHGSFNYAVRYFPVAVLAVLGLLEPVGASIAAYLLFGEAPGWVALVGMALVLIGVSVAMWPSNRRLAQEAAQEPGL